MLTSSGHKRLDDFEIHLSPRQWAIQLAKELRQYPDEQSFWKAIIRTEYPDCILFKPLFKLSRQAEARYPGKGRDNIAQRIHLSQELQTEFQELKLLIFEINAVIENKSMTIALAAAFTAMALQNDGLKDEFSAVSRAAATWIRRAGKGKGQSPRMLRLLTRFTYFSPIVASRIESLADDLVAFMKNALNHEAGVRIAQDRYFDGQPILFRNVEALLKKAIEATTNAITQSELLFPFRTRAHVQAMRKRIGSIDVEQMKKRARATATMDILHQSGVNGTNSWRIFRAMTSENYELNKPGGPVAET